MLANYHIFHTSFIAIFQGCLFGRAQSINKEDDEFYRREKTDEGVDRDYGRYK